MVTLRFFASLREVLGVDDEKIELPAGVLTIHQLTEWLEQRGGQWATALQESRSIHVAVNQQVGSRQTAVTDGDEVAYFPPMTGG
jgi:molybdopterin synthase sulfur carrier subunit